jgi:hypothetical protein
MAHSVSPHFERHRREILRTRRRFSAALLLLCAGLSVALGSQYYGGRAATMYTVSGRVYNATTGAGYPNVTIDLCNGFSAITNGSGNWAISMSDYYCVRYVSGAPGGLVGPVASNNNPEHQGAATYEWQRAGQNCYHNSACLGPDSTWDRAVDTGNNLYFTNPAPTPPPPTPATPKPATPKPATPKLATPKPGPVAVVVGPTSAPAVLVDTTAPSTPDGFQALVDGDNALVNLSWNVSTDNVTIKGYWLERSLDQSTWMTLTEAQSDTQYKDDAVAFGLKYYYRVRAIDAAGNASAPAIVDATTPAFTANTGFGTTTYTSSDKLANVAVPSGALNVEANCSVSEDKKILGTKDLPLIAGGYVLVCKDTAGKILSETARPLTWSVNLSGKLKNYTNPQAMTQGSGGKAAPLTGAKFDDRSQVFQFTSASLGPVAVVASRKSGLSPNIIIVIVLVVLLGGGAAVLMLRRRQVATYDDYLRSKYYNF